MRQIGKGFAGAFKLCSTLNLPRLTKTAYKNQEAKLLKVVQEVAEESMIKAATEIVEKQQNLSSDIVKCGISVDGTWQRRGYTSMNGRVAAISVDTGKVLDIEVMSSYCPTSFKDDPDFVINLLNLSIEDRQAKAERQLQETNSQLELEKIKLQQIEREIELQKTLAEGQATQQSSKGDTNNLENLIKSVKTLTIQIPTKTENFGLFFQYLERSFRVKIVPENLKAEILLNILGERAHNILLYIKDDEIKGYDLVKSLILREFQPTAQECLLNFRKAKRQADETHVQFTTR
ncbi:integrase catalytic domain-containing protein [Trichonephila clavipes]|nr:integrase catalytic domain-containing protein [Trichonephila clavipes]